MSMDTRPYKDGHFCVEHTPAKTAGRDEPPAEKMRIPERRRRSYAREYAQRMKGKKKR